MAITNADAGQPVRVILRWGFTGTRPDNQTVMLREFVAELLSLIGDYWEGDCPSAEQMAAYWERANRLGISHGHS